MDQKSALFPLHIVKETLTITSLRPGLIGTVCQSDLIGDSVCVCVCIEGRMFYGRNGVLQAIATGGQTNSFKEPFSLLPYLTYFVSLACKSKEPDVFFSCWMRHHYIMLQEKPD